MDFARLDREEQLTMAAGAVGLVCLFLPWRDVFGLTVNAWSSGLFAWGGCLLLVAAAIVLLLRAVDRPVQGDADQIAFYLSLASLVLLVLSFLTLDGSARIGIVLATAGAALATWATNQARSREA